MVTLFILPVPDILCHLVYAVDLAYVIVRAHAPEELKKDARSILVELGTCMRVVAGSNPALTEVASAVVRS